MFNEQLKVYQPLPRPQTLVQTRGGWRNRRLTGALVIAGVVATMGAAAYGYQGVNHTDRLQTLNAVLLQAQDVGLYTAKAMMGGTGAGDELTRKADALHASVQHIAEASPMAAEASRLAQVARDLQRGARELDKQQATLARAMQGIHEFEAHSVALQDASEAVLNRMTETRASASEIRAAAHLVYLGERMAHRTHTLFAPDGVDLESVFLLSKSLNTFNTILDAMHKGDVDNGIVATRDNGTKALLQNLTEQHHRSQEILANILGDLNGLISAKDAQSAILKDAQDIRVATESIQKRLLTARPGL